MERPRRHRLRLSRNYRGPVAAIGRVISCADWSISPLTFTATVSEQKESLPPAAGMNWSAEAVRDSPGVAVLINSGESGAV